MATWAGAALNMYQVKEGIVASYTKLVVYGVGSSLCTISAVCSFGLKEALAALPHVLANCALVHYASIQAPF